MKTAQDFVDAARERCGADATPQDLWKVLHREILTPTVDFAIHQSVYDLVYKDQTIRPVWFPDHHSQETNIGKVSKQLNMSYHEFYKYSIVERDRFWMHAQNEIGIVWETAPTRAFDSSGGYYENGRLNIVDSLLQHDANHAAIVFANEHLNLQTWNVSKLQQETNRVSNSIAQQFPIGTAIGVCVPLTPEAIAVYLGIIQAGCVVVSIADSFSSSEIAMRLQIARAQAIFTQDVIDRGAKILPLYPRVVEAVQTLETDLPVIVLPSSLHTGDYSNQVCEVHPSIELRDQDRFWGDFLSNNIEFESVKVDSMTPCNILFSSGTTGKPKAIVWNHTTLIKSAVDGYYHQNIHKECIAWPTSLGWMMGSWLIAQYVNQATLCLYQGLPHTEEFCRFIELSDVRMLGVIPSLVQTWQSRNIPIHWPNVTRFSSTGEASDSTNYHWLSSRIPGYAPIIEYCGGTEIGGSFLSSCLELPNVPSMFNTPVLGADLRLLDGDRCILKDSEFLNNTRSVSGELVLIPPSVGYSTKLLNRDHYETYHSGMPLYKQKPVRKHGDEFEIVREKDNLYFRALGRCDDTMNLGGIKISSVELERVCNGCHLVQEVAAIAVHAPSKLVIYAVAQNREELCETDLKRELQTAIKKNLNPLFGLYDVKIVDSLPRTASNKIMRRLLRDSYLKNHA